MLILMRLFQAIPKRFKQTFLWTASLALIIHLYIFTNNYLNHDSLFDFYANSGSDSSGRFSLMYFKGLTSFFSLHYIQGILSVIFLGLTVALLVELFDLKTKWIIIPFSVLYVSYPTVAGTFSYMFTSHAYFLACLITVLGIYLCFKIERKWLAIVIGSILFYLALGTYQINLAYGATLILLLFLKQLLTDNNVAIKSLSSSILMLGIGLIGYIVHFKVYQKVNGLLDYNGISNSGKIDLETIIQANDNIFKDIKYFFFNDFHFERLFEMLNVAYFALFVILFILVIIMRKVSILKIILAIVTIILLPYSLYLIYFISPDVEYHLIMKQHFALLFIVGLALLQTIVSHQKIIVQIFAIVALTVFSLIGYNQILISNIYYEKLSDLNQETFSLMTRVAYDIQHTSGYKIDTEIVIVGYPSIMMKVPERYDLFTPKNVGTNSRIVYDYASAMAYLRNEIGLPNNVPKKSTQFIEQHQEEFKTMNNWPEEGSIQFIDDKLVIKFSGGN